jgi:hypothetical protein
VMMGGGWDLAEDHVHCVSSVQSLSSSSRVLVNQNIGFTALWSDAINTKVRFAISFFSLNMEASFSKMMANQTHHNIVSY